MKTARHLPKVTLALAVLSSLGTIESAQAAGTAAGQDISNQATVSYSVSSVAQTPIESSPTGNSVPGSGAPTLFEVDRRIFMSVADITGAPGTVAGATNVVRAFTVTNTTNAPVGFSLVAANVAAGDNFDVTISNVFVDSAPAAMGSYTPGTYDAGTDTATSIASLAVDSSVTVYVLATIPNTATNTQLANITLQATAVEPTGSTFGTPGNVITQTAGADTPAVVDTVFGDAGRDGIEVDTNVYTISSAALSVAKTASVIDDPFNGTTNPKAIPGATIQYTITVNNTGAQAATAVTLNDPIPANTAYVPGSITVNAASVADAGRTVGSPVTAINLDPGAIAASGTATVTFRVIINAVP